LLPITCWTAERARAMENCASMTTSGYPLKAGHAVASITYREGLMALPRPGQVIDLR